MAATPTHDAGIANDTAELRKPVLVSLCLFGAISGWLWVALLVMLQGGVMMLKGGLQ